MLRLKSFTLIELLVVVAIIAVLVSILLPALSSAREQAKRVMCGSDIRQVVIAVTAYADENAGWYPVLNAHSPPERLSCYLWETTGQGRKAINPFLPSGKIFYCPSNKWRQWEVYEAIWENWSVDLFVGYSIIFGEHPNVDSPWARFIHYSGTDNEDGTYPVKNTRGINDSSTRVLITDMFDEGIAWIVSYDLNLHNHTDEDGGAGANQGFVDGHVEWKHPGQMQLQFYINIARDWW